MKVRRILARLWQRVGRRGISLMFVGSLSMVLAASLIWIPPDQAASPSYLMLASLAPLSLWAALWLASGLLAYAQAFVSQDRIAYAVTSGMWWLYGIIYVVGAIIGLNPRGWVGGLVWIAFGGWVNLIATWPEAFPPPPRAPEEGVAHAEHP